MSNPMNDLYRVVEVFSFLEIKTLLRISQCCKLWHLLVSEICKSSPSLIVKDIQASDNNYTKFNLFSNIQSVPTLAILFGTDYKIDTIRKRYFDDICKQFPSTCKILYVQTSCVQTANKGNQFNYDDSSRDQPSKSTVMIGSFPEAAVTLFSMNQRFCRTSRKFEINDENLMAAGMNNPQEDWKVFIVCAPYSVDGGFLETLIEKLQNKYPNASILGGLTGQKFGVSTNKSFSMLSVGEVAIIGMRGEVPLKTVVTRGMESISPQFCASIASVVQGNFLLKEFTQVNTNEPFDVLHHLQLHDETTQNQNQLMLGVKTSPNSAYSLKNFGYTDIGVFYPVDDPDLEKAVKKPERIIHSCQFFQLSPKACRMDITTSLELAKTRFTFEGLTPMGCLMFTCNGRGPEPNEEFFNDEALDAKTFTSIFPNAPLIGCYCGGEIGPEAMAGESSETILRSGSAKVQGFTAVFGIFAFPKQSSPYDIIRRISSQK